LSNLRDVLPGSSQTDSSVEVPHGHYAEESMKQTVVPNRNMILLSVAIGHAIAHKCDAVAYAAHAGDHAIYPDCRREFVQAMQGAAQLCDWRRIDLLSPFVDFSKADIVEQGELLGVDFSKTYSCYEGNEIHCGKCGTCTERKEAFELNSIKDPTQYRA
jgi:7-cyano-7-deazaguanine synthase